MARVNVFDKDVGTVIQLETGVDLTNAIEVAILAEDPHGETHVLDASVTDTTKIKHVKRADTLHIPGKWRLQAYVKFSDSSEYYGEIATLLVGETLA